MHAIAALLAAEHFNDLIREAQEERLRRLANSARPHRPPRTFGVGRRVFSGVRRLLGQSSPSSTPRPAGA